jgi:hypothetical protein
LEENHRLRKKDSIGTETSKNQKAMSDFSLKLKNGRPLDTLKQQYPKYYKMRYATVPESLDDKK